MYLVRHGLESEHSFIAERRLAFCLMKQGKARDAVCRVGFQLTPLPHNQDLSEPTAEVSEQADRDDAAEAQIPGEDEVRNTSSSAPSKKFVPYLTRSHLLSAEQQVSRRVNAH